MKRKVYLICQRKEWYKGKPQVLSDGCGKIIYVFASNEGLKKAELEVKKLNKNTSENPVHLREAIIDIGKEIKQKKEKKDGKNRSTSNK